MKLDWNLEAKFFFQQSLNRFQAGEYEVAIALLDKALLCRPDYADAWSHRGFVLGKLGQHIEAIINFERALAIKPEASWVWHNRGTALGKLGLFNAAIDSSTLR